MFTQMLSDSVALNLSGRLIALSTHLSPYGTAPDIEHEPANCIVHSFRQYFNLSAQKCLKTCQGELATHELPQVYPSRCACRLNPK